MMKISKWPIFAILLSLLFSFNSFAMESIMNGDFVRPTPLNESETSGFKWTWISDGTVEKANVVSRYTYSGKWSQSSEGIWSFEFDDKTIPVGVTKIDGVLYAFTGYGELKADYEYYDGLKTEADGLVKADSAEFALWLTTQYLPECTSHE